MPDLNVVHLIGNVTRDPELRYTPNNVAVANLGLAINRKYKDQNGEQQKDTTFVDCTAWGRTAEVLNEYVKKGDPLYVGGRLTLDQWQDQQGNNRQKLKVTVENMQFLKGQSQQNQGAGTQQQGAPQGQSGSGGVEPDDIPFSPDPPGYM